jgi:hypothetical protein
LSGKRLCYGNWRRSCNCLAITIFLHIKKCKLVVTYVYQKLISKEGHGLKITCESRFDSMAFSFLDVDD